MTTIYRSSDASAPQMTSVAGSLISVLDAVLVNGYGAKGAAGWAKTVLNASTNEVAYTQGAATGKAQRLLYIKDDNTWGGHTAGAWCCSAATVSATPVLTNNYWDQATTGEGCITKADQDLGGAAKWTIVANARSALILTKRTGFGTRGWAMTFVGDLTTPYSNDKGAFGAIGRNLVTNGALALSSGVPTWNNGVFCCYGNPDGVYAPTQYTWSAFGSSLLTTVPLHGATLDGLLLTQAQLYSVGAYRGYIPWFWHILTNALYAPWYGMPDNLAVAGAGNSSGMQFEHYQFDPINQSRALVETAGFMD